MTELPCFSRDSLSFIRLGLDALSELGEFNTPQSGPVLFLYSWTHFCCVGSRLPEPKEQRNEQDELRHHVLGAAVHQTQHSAEGRKQVVVQLNCMKPGRVTLCRLLSTYCCGLGKELDNASGLFWSIAASEDTRPHSLAQPVTPRLMSNCLATVKMDRPRTRGLMFLQPLGTFPLGSPFKIWTKVSEISSGVCK